MTNQKGDINGYQLFAEELPKSAHFKRVFGLTRRRHPKHSDRVTTTKRGFNWFGLRAKRASTNDMGKDKLG